MEGVRREGGTQLLSNTLVACGNCELKDSAYSYRASYGAGLSMHDCTII